MTRIIYVIIAWAVISSAAIAQDKKPFTYEDVMKFNDLHGASISDDGAWAAWWLDPDRGNPTGVVRATDTNIIYKVERGARPKIAKNSAWAAFRIEPDAIEAANADPKNKPNPGMAIVNLANGNIKNIENVKQFKFSDDSRWMAYVKYYEGDAPKNKSLDKKAIGDELSLRHMNSGTEITIPFVNEFIFDSLSQYIFYAVSSVDGKSDGVYYRALDEEFAPEFTIIQKDSSYFSNLEWNKPRSVLAFLGAPLMDKGQPDVCLLHLWNGVSNEHSIAVDSEKIPADWYIPHKNSLKWTKDGDRVFLGIKPVFERDTTDEDKIEFTEEDYYNKDKILKKTELTMWHWDDPRIATHRDIWWKQSKDRTFRAVYHLDPKKFVKLADTELSNVPAVENPDYALGYDDTPYLKRITWEGWFNDLYLVDLISGERKLIAKELTESAYIAPSGKYVGYFMDGDWYIYNVESGKSDNVTEPLQPNFWQEDWDVPIDPPSYGFGGWYEEDMGMMVYDKYDIWTIETGGQHGALSNTVAEGRLNEMQFRIIHYDKNKEYYSINDTMLVSGFHTKEKYQGIYFTDFRVFGITDGIVNEDKRIHFAGKAEDVDQMLFTRESFEEFPDLWTCDMLFRNARKLSDANPQMKDYRWGTTELVEFQNAEGDTLQGYIIKPDDYQPGKKYPVLIYFYERFSDRAKSFVQPAINHRPCFPVYL
ncbi:MAG: hypothetical protein ACLFQX_13155, partial [Candidatus Kapaibacterium sp.]